MKHPFSIRHLARQFWLQWLQPAALFALIVFPLRSSLADWNWVPTGSMKPTILEGDLIFVNKAAYGLRVPFTQKRLLDGDQPSRDDIAVFFSPEDGTRLVKRIVACPGDKLEMRNNVLILNGKPMQYALSIAHGFHQEIQEDSRPLVAREQSGSRPSHWVMSLPSRPALHSFPEITLGPDQFFMMGDSRDNSHDSRFFGPVDRTLIVGRASRVLVSLDSHRYGRPRFGRFFSTLND